MKPYYLLTFVFFLLSCSNAGSLKKAVFVQDSKYNKKYHFILSIPQPLMTHDPISSLKKKYLLVEHHIYTDSLGKVLGNQVLLGVKGVRPVHKDVTFIFTKKSVIIRNFKSCDTDNNCSKMPDVDGVYPINDL
jgi:hypothetical protein